MECFKERKATNNPYACIHKKSDYRKKSPNKKIGHCIGMTNFSKNEIYNADNQRNNEDVPHTEIYDIYNSIDIRGP